MVEATIPKRKMGLLIFNKSESTPSNMLPTMAPVLYRLKMLRAVSLSKSLSSYK